MVLIEEPYQKCSCESSEHLGYHVAWYGTPVHRACQGASDADCRVKMRSRDGSGDEDSHHYGEAPSECDHHPSGALRLTFVQTCRGAYAVAKKNEHHSSEELEDAFGQ